MVLCYLFSDEYLIILRNNLDVMAISTSKAGKIAIIGASGYGGLQLVKLLNEHPIFEISTLNGERSVGKSWNEINPFMKLLGDKDAELEKANEEVCALLQTKLDLTSAIAEYINDVEEGRQTINEYKRVLKQLEKKLNKVVLSSNQVLIWDTLQSIGKKDSIEGFGKLFKN